MVGNHTADGCLGLFGEGLGNLELQKVIAIFFFGATTSATGRHVCDISINLYCIYCKIRIAVVKLVFCEVIPLTDFPFAA
jgi:hypothetical protein